MTREPISPRFEKKKKKGRKKKKEKDMVYGDNGSGATGEIVGLRVSSVHAKVYSNDTRIQKHYSVLHSSVEGDNDAPVSIVP